MRLPGNRTTLVFACILFLANTACTTIRPIYGDQQAPFASQIEPGDRVRLTFINDRVKEIRVTEVDEAGIKGTTHKASTTQRKGALVDAEWKDIYSVEGVRISALKTAGAAVGVVVAIPLLVLGAVMAGAGAY